nr:F-box/LRR-repeat protein 10 [Ipomoea batatas]
MANSSESGRENEHLPDSLPSALLGYHDDEARRSFHPAHRMHCKNLYSLCLSHPFLPSFHLLDIAFADMLRPLLPPNPYLRSLKLIALAPDSSRFHSSSDFCKSFASINCSDFSESFFLKSGRGCTDLSRNSHTWPVTCRGEELRLSPMDTSDDLYMHDYDEVDELEQWLLARIIMRVD